ncbi:MFS transporter [Candidatus Parcubacteria bacterium]|nr:MAG: MFS transporter [Candidatus Parcubacteria bacterium]
MNATAKILLTVESIWAFGSGLFFPIFAIFSHQVGGDILDAGIAAALFLIVTSTLEWPVGRLLDKYKEKWFIVTDYFLEAAVFVGYVFVASKWELFALQVVLGISNAIGDPAWESLYDKHTPLRRAGSYWASSHMYIGWATAVGLLIGAYVVDLFGFKPVFLLGAFLSLTAGFIALHSIREKQGS